MTGLGDGCETRGRDFLTGGDGATAGFDPGGACCGTATYQNKISLTHQTEILTTQKF
jgi:hypothetical protein